MIEIEPGRPFCIVLVRRPERTKEPKLAERSGALTNSVIFPVLDLLGYRFQQVDPAEYGINDKQFFSSLSRADLVIVDPYARSQDYMYSLGARHALTSGPTVILSEQDSMPFDVSIPRGIFFYRPDELEDPRRLAERLRDYLEREVINRASSPFSPVKIALEQVPRVFLSYAHADKEAVVAVDQWLRDKGARVDFDERDFIAGGDIRDQIIRSVERAGKIVCFYSKSSEDRYYTKLERRLVEEREQRLSSGQGLQNLLLYFRLDQTSLPAESSYRLAINAFAMRFREACQELWRHLLEQPAEPKRVDLSKYEESPPW